LKKKKVEEKEKTSANPIYVRCLMACFRKRLNAATFRRVYLQCLTDIECWIDELPRDFVLCDEECDKQNLNFEKKDQECVGMVTQAKKHYAELKPEEREAFTQNIERKIKERKPSAKEELVKRFSRAIFTRISSARICMLYTTLFE